MVDYTYKLDLDEPVEMGSRFRQEPRKGIGVQPKKEEPEAEGWGDMFWGLLKGYFGDEDEANKALGPKQPSTSYDMDGALETLKSVSRISEPVIEGAPEKFSMPKPEPFELQVDTIGNEALDRDATRLVDVTDTEEGKLTNVKPLEELAEAVDPGTIDTEPLDADGGASTSGKGLMSPTTEETTKTVTDLVYDDFVGDKQEGDEAHVGQDNKNITLAGGVVPDGLKYDGKDFAQGSAEVVGFDKTKLDTSNAYKKVGSVTVKRSDFDSDKAFAKGVIEEFKKQAEKAAGDSWSKMSEGSKKAVVKIGWNKGTGWYTGESAKAIYTELAKEEPNATNLYSKILTGSTVKGGGASIGIAKARANAWNETISATGGKEIVKIEADNTGTNTAFKYYDKDGNLLHTEQTSRASTKYENKGTGSISKNSQGAW
jgi:hypothetical protein